MAEGRPLVTVYVTCHNYGRFLRECLDSVLGQSLAEWELVVFDDGSTDDSRAIAEAYAARDARVRVVSTDEPRGVRACANQAIQEARGRYLMRLDADDYLDPNALLVLSHALDADDRAGLAYPNWTYVDESGSVLGVEYRKRPGSEVEVADLPPHGACTMARLRSLKVTGGYDPAFDAQDGHELWLKLLNRYGAVHVPTPLFFYRQHGSSMSRDEERLLGARRAIKRQAAGRFTGPTAPRVAAVVPVKNTYPHMVDVALQPVGGKPLVDHTLDEAVGAGCFDVVLVTTDDERVVEHCRRRGDVLAELRPPELSAITSRLTDVLHHAVGHLEEVEQRFVDVVALLSAHSPLRRREHIREAVDTLLLYDTDHVVSVYEDLDVHFSHGRLGMEPLNPGMTNQLRYEREALFVDNGAVHVLWRDLVERETRLAGRVGHIVMRREDSMQIKSLDDRDLVDALLQLRARREA